MTSHIQINRLDTMNTLLLRIANALDKIANPEPVEITYVTPSLPAIPESAFVSLSKKGV